MSHSFRMAHRLYNVISISLWQLLHQTYTLPLVVLSAVTSHFPQTGHTIFSFKVIAPFRKDPRYSARLEDSGKQKENVLFILILPHNFDLVNTI